MKSEEAKKLVASGLERRRENRRREEQNARLERFEQEMILTCNAHSASAKARRKAEETGRLNRQMVLARQAAREEVMARELAREEAAKDAVRKYVMACLAIFCLTIFTYLPVWAAVTTVMGLAVFPVAYILRLYCPMEG